MKAIKHKKLLSLVLAFAMIFSIFSIMPLSASAAEPAEKGTKFTEGALTYNVQTDTTTVQVYGFDKSITDVVIPETVTYNDFEYDVTSIYAPLMGNGPFKGTNITSINIPGSIKSIPMSCFQNCTSLQKVTLNEGTTQIAGSAFMNTGLKEVTLRNVNIAASFNNCTKLERINIYEDVTLYSATAKPFKGCTEVKDVYFFDAEMTIPDTLLEESNTTLTVHGFKGSTAETYASSKGFTFVEIREDETEPTTEPIETEPTTEPETEPTTEAPKPAEVGTKITQSPLTYTVTSNKKNSLTVSVTGYDNSTTEVTIPESITYEDFTYTVTAIDADAFYGNTNITSVNIPGTVKTVDNSITTTIKGSFQNCTSLTTVTLNEGIETINSYAFRNTAISKIEFPDSLKQIGMNAFAGTKLEEVTLKDVEIENSSFKDCTSLKTIHFYGDVKGKLTPFAGCTAIEDAYFYNRDMEINRTMLSETNSTLTVHGYWGSTAQTFAALKIVADNQQTFVGKPEFKFVSFDEPQTEATTVPGTEPTTNATEPTTDTTEPTTDATEPTTNATEPTSTPAPVYEEFILGDADGNGIVNIKDVTYIQLYLARLLNETENPIPTLSACEVDGDGEITIKDVTQIQLWLAKFNVEFNIGELVKKEITPGTTEPTTPSETVPGGDVTEAPTTEAPTTEPSTTEPTTAPDPNGTIKFYVPNDVTWLTNDGGKMWLYNDETKEFKTMEYDAENNYFFLEIPVSWSVLSIYRTPYETSEGQFNINDKRTETNSGGVILNYWENLGSRGNNDCFYITADGEGLYKKYTPPVVSDEKTRTIYFDNSKTKWSEVYIYGWNTSMGFISSGSYKPMENIGNDIWSFTFEEGKLPKDGIKGFLFVASKTSWDQQTDDLATEEGKNLFIPNAGSGKVSGKWGIYNP